MKKIMMRLYGHLFVVLLLLSACADKAETVNTDQKDTDGKTTSKVITKQELQDQLIDAVPYVEKHPSGAVKIQGQKVGDLKVGKWTSYYPNGVLWSESEYYKGQKNGKFRDYFDNGMLRYKGAYVNDMKQGPWYFYEEDGKINQKVTYHQGEIVKE